MSIKSFIPKQNQELPDSYGLTIYHIDGTSKEFEVASHFHKNGLFELMTKDDFVVWIPMENVKRVEFDKNFSKIIDIRQKEEIAKQKELLRVQAKG